MKTEKIKLSLNDQNDPEINYQKYLKDNRLNGGQFEVVNSEKLNSDVYLNSDKLDYLQSKEVLTNLYQQIEDLILKGEYAITPDQKACRYCDFKGICHHEETRKKMELTQRQAQAIDQFGNDLSLKPAGAGKTRVLIERITKEILSGKIDIDRILAMTSAGRRGRNEEKTSSEFKLRPVRNIRTIKGSRNNYYYYRQPM